MEAVGSHIQVSYRLTFLTASWQRLSRRRWRLWGPISRYAIEEPFLLHPGRGCQERDAWRLWDLKSRYAIDEPFLLHPWQRLSRRRWRL
jgi:hypothetical protein